MSLWATTASAVANLVIKVLDWMGVQYTGNNTDTMRHNREADAEQKLKDTLNHLQQLAQSAAEQEAAATRANNAAEAKKWAKERAKYEEAVRRFVAM